MKIQETILAIICTCLFALTACKKDCTSYLPRTEGEKEKTFGALTPLVSQAITQTSDGGFLLLGYQNTGEGNLNMYAIKLKSNLRKQWAKSLGQKEGRASGYIIKQTSDGGYIILGQSNFGNYYSKATVTKTNEKFEQCWQKVLNISPRNYIETDDNNYLILGTNHLIDRYSAMKIDHEGNLIWQKEYEYDRWANFAVGTHSGGGIFFGPRTNEHPFVKSVEIDNSGDIIAVDTISMPQIMKKVDDGYIYIRADTVVKLNKDRNENWRTTIEGNYNIHDIISTSDSYLMIGKYEYQCGYDNPSSNACLLEFDKSGNLLREEYYGVGSAHRIIIDDNGNYIMLGTSNDKFYLIKTN